MARVVAALGLPHSPGYPAQVEREGPSSETAQLYAAIASRLDAVRPDLLVVFDSDHLNTFSLTPLPALCVGVTHQSSGPNDGTPSVPSYTVPVDEASATALLQFGLNAGFDLAATYEFTLDHSIMVPLHFVRPQMDIPIVPVFINGIVAPIPQARRCLELGRMVDRAMQALPQELSVAVLASGDFSNDVGGVLAPPDSFSGSPDVEWAQRVVDLMRHADVEDLVREATTARMARAGNVAGELLNWIALLGAVGPTAPAFLEPQPDEGHAYGFWYVDGRPG
jgi:aromatic ring-opening dioxygenase catalytic subunit (LigB family)